MPLYLAIDAGGTKTNCLIADSNRVLARASTGSVKLMRVSVTEATTRLHGMLSEAAASANISLSQITRTCFGLAGLTIPAVRAWATATIAANVSGQLILCGDEEIALDAAFGGGPGILVIAGTGSNIIGRAPDGSLHTAGGWGPVLGDEGAGYWIGLEAIRAALRAHDREPSPLPSAGPDSPGAPSMTTSRSWAASANPAVAPSAILLDEIQCAWNLNSLAELIEFGNHRGDATHPAPDFASLAPIVARLAGQGNPIAAAILNRAGEDLAAQVALVARKLGAPSMTASSSWVGFSDHEPQPSPLEVAFTGSVLTRILPVRTAMTSSLALTVPAARVHSAPADPLDGALWRARNG